jgi:hypothetical protein
MSDEKSDLVKVTLVESRPQRPPLQLLYFDAWLWNPAGVARYYLLSDHLSAAGESGDYDIDVAYVYELSGEGRIMVSHFAGTRGFFALLLPPGARLELRNLPLEFWGELPAEVTLTVAIGEDLKIAGQAVENWLDINLQSDKQSAVDAGALSDQLEVIKSKSVTGRDRTAVELGAAGYLRLVVPLSE